MAAEPVGTSTGCSCGDRTRPNVNHRINIPCWTYVGMKRCDVDVDGRIVSGTLPVPAGDLWWWHEKLAQTLDPAHHSAEWKDNVKLVLLGIERALSAKASGSPVIDDAALASPLIGRLIR